MFGHSFFWPHPLVPKSSPNYTSLPAVSRVCSPSLVRDVWHCTVVKKFIFTSRSQIFISLWPLYGHYFHVHCTLNKVFTLRVFWWFCNCTAGFPLSSVALLRPIGWLSHICKISSLLAGRLLNSIQHLFHLLLSEIRTPSYYFSRQWFKVGVSCSNTEHQVLPYLRSVSLVKDRSCPSLYLILLTIQMKDTVLLILSCVSILPSGALMSISLPVFPIWAFVHGVLFVLGLP